MKFVLNIALFFPLFCQVTTAIGYDCNIKNLPEDLSKVESDIDLILSKVRHKNKLLNQQEMRLRPSKVLENYFNSCLKKFLIKESFAEYSNKQLNEVFLNIDTLHFYIENESLAQVATKIVEREVQIDGIEENIPKLLTLEEMLIQSRMFSERLNLIDKFPKVKFSDLQIIQDKSNSNKRRILTVSGSKDLSVETVSLPEGGHVIVVSHPLCHFSQSARTFIKNNDHLLDIMIERSTWLVPNSRRMYLDTVGEDNKYNKGLSYVYSYSDDDWSEIDYWGTPAFYFYMNGELIYRFIGWPKGGSRDKFIEGLKMIGLL